MNSNHSVDSVFIKRLTKIVEANIADENFGVTELAQKMGLNRSQLYRKLKSEKNISVSQFIREIRLIRAKEMLLNDLGSVSEIAYKVGFSSPSYFIRCFHEYFDYPPGEFIKYSPENSGNTSSNLDDYDITVKSNQNRLANNKLSFTKYKVAIFGILVIVILSFFVYHYFKGEPKKINLAVLPLTIDGNNIEDQEWADGLMSDIRLRLSQINRIVVKSRFSSELVRNQSYTLEEIIQKLGADYIVSGTFYRNGERIETYIELLDTKNGNIIWFDKYNYTEIRQLSANVSREIADKLQLLPTTHEQEQIEKRYPTKMKAYTLYLKARFFWDKRSKAGINRSIELFTQAAEIDPNYALALSGLSDAYTILTGYGWSTNKKEDEKNAKDYAVRALEIDSNLAEAHTSLGFIYCYKEWKWEEAEKELSEAMRLNPNYAFAFHIYSLLQDIKGDHFKAREVNELALQLDPLSIILHYVKATLYYNEGNFEKSLNECKEIMDLEPECPDLHVWFFKNYYRQGNGPEALHELQIMLADNKLTQEYTEMANQYYIEKGLDGLVDLIVKITDEIKLANPEDVKKIYWEGYLSDIYAIAGEKEEALTYLEHYLETNSNGDRLVRLINNPDYIILRSEPRFKAVLNKLGLMEYYKQALTNTQAQAK